MFVVDALPRGVAIIRVDVGGRSLAVLSDRLLSRRARRALDLVAAKIRRDGAAQVREDEIAWGRPWKVAAILASFVILGDGLLDSLISGDLAYLFPLLPAFVRLHLGP